MRIIMIIGLLKEIKTEEYRVGLTPFGAAEYVAAGHRVLVEKSAGIGSGFADIEYQANGCEIVTDRKKIADDAGMIIKVKEPLPSEYDLFHGGQILYTYLHLAADRRLTEVLLSHKVSAFAYETVMEADGSLPLLAPMSQIAGRLSAQEGAKYLEKPCGGRGILLGGVPGTSKGKVLILGGGVAGSNACRIALGMGADVTIMDISLKRLTEIEQVFGNAVKTIYSSRNNILSELTQADLVIGAVLLPGALAPHLIKKEDLSLMKPGSVMVDIAIDQGGCFETSHATTNSDPVFVVDGVVHYCVANMPGAVSMSSTIALGNVTGRYGLILAGNGTEQAIEKSTALKMGLNCFNGKLTNQAVAETHKMDYHII
ncbi:MAG: alanine dehydrogenase [Victivallaceae bacterium]|nr:alanine dehydrogenase [Victivallaceae bacterium]